MELTFIKKQEALPVAIFILWLFQVSGLIGISIGYDDWFLSKTPLNLSLVLLAILLFFPIDHLKVALAAGSFFLTGMIVEWIGVHYEFLFGSYYYGENLGWKIYGVPLLIGVNWMFLTLVTGCVATHLFKNSIVRIIVAAFMMVFLDFFIEVSAPPFDFWIWEQGTAPLQNYVSWFIIAAVLQSVYQALKIKGNVKISKNIYLSQLVFFVYFYFINS